jgi:hypothetical protein
MVKELWLLFFLGGIDIRTPVVTAIIPIFAVKYTILFHL